MAISKIEDYLYYKYSFIFVHCESHSISEKVQNRDIVTTDH